MRLRFLKDRVGAHDFRALMLIRPPRTFGFVGNSGDAARERPVLSPALTRQLAKGIAHLISRIIGRIPTAFETEVLTYNTGNRPRLLTIGGRGLARASEGV
jgi:hypothetical protein